MPLLSNKLYILNKIRKDKKDEESVFCHPLTNEICENQDEINRKTFLYNQKIWTCRITGQINLTYKEALKSEQGCSKMLKNSFKKCFEAVVLQFVHHNKESLDTLIHKAWTQIHQEFCVNEPVSIKITTPKEMILKGIVVKVDRSRSNEDKEQENSPIKLNSDASSSDKENMKKKVIPVKKNYFYSVKIFEMDKLVKDIPSETIDRTLRPPSKDQIRMFIRAHAIRHSGKQNNPWVVDDDLVKKYRLPVLEPEFVVDKMKMKELSRSTEIQVYHKMREEHKDTNCTATASGTTVDLTRSDDDELEHVQRPKKQSNESKVNKNKKMKQTTLFEVQQAPGATSTPTASNQRNSGNQIRSPLSSPTRSLPPLAQRLLKLMKENSTDPSVKQLIFKCGQLFSNQQISKFPDLIKIPIKDRKEKYDEKKRLDAMSPEEREAYMTERRNQLRRQMRDKKREENIKQEDNELEYSKSIPEGTAVQINDGLSSQDQWARLVSVSEFVRCYKRLLVPSSTGGSEGIIDDSETGIDAGELCKSVVEESDNAHQVLAELVCVLLKTLLQDNRVRNRKEMGLGLTELPVTACTAGELLRLVLPLGGERRSGDSSTNRGGCDADGGTNKEEDAVNELVNDISAAAVAAAAAAAAASNNKDDEEEDAIFDENNKIAVPICDKLRNAELHELSVEEKISVLELLQSRILELDVVSSFIDDYQREVCEAYKKRVSDTKEFNDKLKVIRQSKQDMCRVTIATTSATAKNGGDVESGGNCSSETATTEEANISSQVMRRRQSIEMKMKESEEREKKLEKERQFQKLEREEMQYKKCLEQCQKAYTTALNDAKRLMRVQPLGTDRHFRRYWHFSTAPGVLYVETEQEEETTRWNMYCALENVQELLDSLCEKGMRESTLKAELASILPKLKEEMETLSKGKEKSQTEIIEQRIDNEPSECFLVVGFKHELKETEISIRQGSLGGVEDYEEWQKRLDAASSIDEMKQALVSVFLGVHERFWNPPLKSANGRNEFLNAVELAGTQGRLNVLQSFLDACVCWSKSAKDDKCRICRKNSDENAMLLCDSCNHAFHTFCLRPPLQEIPEGEWFCPHCKPVSRARDNEDTMATATATNTAAAAAGGGKEREREKQQAAQQQQQQVAQTVKSSKTRQGHLYQQQQQQQEQCCVCHSNSAANEEQQLAKCTSCKKCFHSYCHEPPLRQIRRTNWHCCECRLDEVTSSSNKNSSRTNKRSSQHSAHSTAAAAAATTVQLDNNDSENDDDDEDEEEDQSDEEERNSNIGVVQERKSAVSKKSIAKKPTQSKPKSKSSNGKIVNGMKKRKKPYNEDNEEDNEEEEEEEESEEEDKSHKSSTIKPPMRKKSRIAAAPPAAVKVEETNRKAEKPRKKSIEKTVVEDESDQDVEDLSNLIGRKRSSRKRSSAGIIKQGEEEEEEDGGEKEEEHGPVLCNGNSSKKAKNELSGEKIEKACYHMLKHMINHKSSWPFRDAVDPEEVPDYYEIISDPINLAQMMDKCKQGAYRSGIKSLKLFLSDVGLMFFNAEVYNLPDSPIMRYASTLEDFFRSIYNKYGFGIEYTRMTE